MAITRAKKVDILKKLNENFQKADSAIFASYKGLSVKDLEGARQQMRENGIDYFIAKKTLIKKAVKENFDFDLSDDVIEGPVGVAFGFEESITLCKVLAKIAKENEEFNLIGGILDKEEAKKESIEELSKMLSKEENLAKFISIIRSPLSTFGGLLSAGTTSFARALKAYAEGKGEEEEIEEKPVEEKVEVPEEKPVEEKVEEKPEVLAKETTEAPKEKKEDIPAEEKVEEKPEDSKE